MIALFSVLAFMLSTSTLKASRSLSEILFRNSLGARPQDSSISYNFNNLAQIYPDYCPE